MTLKAVQSGAHVGDDRDQVAETARDQALALAQAGLPLCARELALILRENIGHFHAKAKRGLFDGFLLRPPLGPKRYSGVLVNRWLNVETREPLAFGRRRRIG